MNIDTTNVSTATSAEASTTCALSMNTPIKRPIIHSKIIISATFNVESLKLVLFFISSKFYLNGQRSGCPV